MPRLWDAHLPKTRLQFPDGAQLIIGTITCDDQIHQAVYLAYSSAEAQAPSMELELPPKSVDVLVGILQERANEARYINGERLMRYVPPFPEPVNKPPAPKKKKLRPDSPAT